jgi:hypothetical protein
LKNILMLMLKVLGVLFALVAIVTVAGAIINPGKARQLKENMGS